MVIHANKTNAMSISCLLPFISDCKDDTNITNLKDKVFGVDAYIRLYKGAYYCPYQLANGIPTSLHIDYYVKVHIPPLTKFCPETPCGVKTSDAKNFLNRNCGFPTIKLF